MIREIIPSSEEKQALSKWVWLAIAYGLTIIFSAMVFGAIIGWMGSLALRSDWLNNDNPIRWTIVIAGIALVYGLSEIGILRLPMPQIHWQVPAHWSKYGKVVQMLFYGTVLGVDIATLIPYGSFYLILFLEAGLGTRDAAIIGFVYGFARAVSTVAALCYLHFKREMPNKLAVHILGNRQLLHRINGVALLVLGELLIGASLVAR